MVVNPVDKSIWGIRHENGLATIVRIPTPYAGFNQIHTFKYGQVPFDLDISRDGTMLSASFGEINGTQSVRVWNVGSLSPDSDPVEVARLDMPPSTPEGFTFAPDGKSLFLTSGERQRFTPAQDPNQALGKILHLTLDGKPAPGNPWAGKVGTPTITVTDPPRDTEAAKNAPGRKFRWPGPNLTPAETWSTGHRNPYGLAFDAKGQLWETEMGPRGGDELNLILPGANYGWPLVSEGKNYDGVPIPQHSAYGELEQPKLTWVPSVSPTSLMIYSGKLFPQWKGSGFIGALSGQALIRVTFSGIAAHKLGIVNMGHRIRWVGEGPDGAIYLLEDGDGARLLKLTPAQARR